MAVDSDHGELREQYDLRVRFPVGLLVRCDREVHTYQISVHRADRTGRLR